MRNASWSMLVAAAALASWREEAGPPPAAAAEPLEVAVARVVRSLPADRGPAIASLPGAPGVASLGFPPAVAVLRQEGSELPPVTVRGDRPGEESLVGANRQPEWTTRRRFATTRTYVRAEGQVEAEEWWRGKVHRNEGPDHRFQSEIGVGLPGRLQLDVYENFERPAGGPFANAGTQVEVRHALAPWGEIPLNPTLYGEFKWNRHAANAVEAKLLLSEELAPGWHGASNLTWEQETAGGRATEMAVSLAVSRTIIDRSLSLGAELVVERATENGSRAHAGNEVLLGPSLQWRPTSRTHLDIVPLYGVTRDAPRMEIFVVFGFDFGTAGEDWLAPTSTKSR